MKLSDRKWGEFKLIDFFEICLSKGDNQANLLKIGKIPLVSAGSVNNGICKYIEFGDGISEIFNNNLITIDMFGKIFYQPHKFYSVSHGRINIIIPKTYLNKYILLFFVSVLEKRFFGKYSFANMCSKKRLERETILLPITLQGKPDYEFMEEYIKEIINKKRQKYIEYVKDKMKSLKVVGGGQSLENRKWKNFKIKELFNIYTGKDLIINKIKNGNIPVVSHSLENNGIVAYTALICDRKKFNFKKTISLADRGNFKAFVQKNDFYIGTRVKALELKLDNVPYFSLIFISNEINKQSCKFSYGHNACDNIKDLQIILPATQQNQPDYEFMENYIKNKMFLKYNKYLQYIKNQ